VLPNEIKAFAPHSSPLPVGAGVFKKLYVCVCVRTEARALIRHFSMKKGYDERESEGWGNINPQNIVQKSEAQAQLPIRMEGIIIKQ
jgi:hypothetical protein